MATYDEIAAAAQARADQTAADRAAVLERVLTRRGGLPDRERLVTEIERSGGEDRAEAEAIADEMIHDLPEGTLEQLPPEFLTEEINDLLDISFLERARTAARAVGRLVHEDGTEAGTCFLISPELILTNHHVIPDADTAAALRVEFNFELGVDDRPVLATRHRLAPTTLFITDGRLEMDFTVVALGEHEDGPVIADPAFCPLVSGNTGHPLGFYVNLVHHPHGDRKQIVLRQNRLVHREGTLLLYTGETRPGSSGCPGFNDRWEVIVLHHFAGPSGSITLPSGLELLTETNEGIAVGAIVEELRTRLDTLQHERELLEQALAGGALATV